MKWSYGVTTVPSRRDTLLPTTLRSLARGGFGYPRLFVDGATEAELEEYKRFGCEISARSPALRTAGNWFLSLLELYLRDSLADRYALFQDDLVTSHNLRSYLESTPYPPRSYLNLYTMPSNQDLVGKDFVGWFRSNQFGRGAVGLVFDRNATVLLLSSHHMLTRPQDLDKGWKSVDGGIVTAMTKEGYSEFVHSPSLVQHTGKVSSMGTKEQPLAPVFRGEDFDLMELLRCE